MRKILLLSSVFAISLCVFAQGDVRAQVETIDKASIDAIKESEKSVIDHISKHIERNSIDGQKSAEQATTVQAAFQANNNAIATARDLTATVRDQNVSHTDTTKRAISIEDGGCVLGSGNMSNELIYQNSERATDEDIQESMDLINSNAGQISENGLVDFQRKMFDISRALCDPSGNGGANSYCTGAGTEHITLASLLRPVGYNKDPIVDDNLDYLRNVLYARIPISVNPDLLEDPNTETMNMVIDSDRLKAELSIGQTVFSMIRGNRTKTETEPSAAKSLRERYEAGGWSDDRIAEAIDNGISKNGLYEALTVGSSNSKFLMQELVSINPVKLLQFIGGQLALNNNLEYEQYKLLEAIALATATNIVVNRDDAIKDLNARIMAVNTR